MLSLPRVVERPSAPHIFVRYTVRMDQLSQIAEEGFPLLFSHVERHGLRPAGPAFYNFRRIDMATTLDVEAGLALETEGPADGSIESGMLPGGKFVTLTWHGHYDALEEITAMLLTWTRHKGLALDMTTAPEGDYFACRLELYETDPSELPDPDDWVTTLAFKLRDGAA